MGGYLEVDRREYFGDRSKAPHLCKPGHAVAELKLSTEGADDRTDDCASGADDVAGRPKVQISTF
jgi:hypothetical protein